MQPTSATHSSPLLSRLWMSRAESRMSFLTTGLWCVRPLTLRTRLQRSRFTTGASSQSRSWKRPHVITLCPAGGTQPAHGVVSDSAPGCSGGSNMSLWCWHSGQRSPSTVGRTCHRVVDVDVLYNWIPDWQFDIALIIFPVATWGTASKENPMGWKRTAMYVYIFAVKDFQNIYRKMHFIHIYIFRISFPAWRHGAIAYSDWLCSDVSQE